MSHKPVCRTLQVLALGLGVLGALGCATARVTHESAVTEPPESSLLAARTGSLQGPGIPSQVARPQRAGSDLPLWPNRVLTALAGGVLGAGLGFFASQVVRGDWDDGPGQPSINRPLWAAAAGAAGFTAGMSFPLSWRAHPPTPEPALAPRGSMITAEEIHEVLAVDAYEAVRLLRPHWLVLRPPNVIGQHPSEVLAVYLDDFRLGGIEKLRGLNAFDIASIRFVGTAEATTRWGVGNAHGAIQVITR
jgi:hypothetical protein